MKSSCFLRNLTQYYKTLEPEGKRPLGRHMSAWDDNITMDLWEIVLEGLD